MIANGAGWRQIHTTTAATIRLTMACKVYETATERLPEASCAEDALYLAETYITYYEKPMTGRGNVGDKCLPGRYSE